MEQQDIRTDGLTQPTPSLSLGKQPNMVVIPQYDAEVTENRTK